MKNKIYGIFDGKKFIRSTGQYEKDQGEKYLEFLTKIEKLKNPRIIEISEYQLHVLTLTKNI